MSTIFNDTGRRAGCFIVSEANKTRSRDTVLIAVGQVLAVGAVIAKGDDDKWRAYDGGGSSGESNDLGILFDKVDASTTAQTAVAIVRDAEVNREELVFGDDQDTGEQDAAVAELATKGILCAPVNTAFRGA